MTPGKVKGVGHGELQSCKLVGPLMSVRESDRILKQHGFRPCTPEESRNAREAIARTDALIARQTAA